MACKISSQTPVMNFLHDGVHISYIRIHVRYVPLYLHKTCQVYKLKIRFNTLSENRNYNWNSDTSYHSDIITCQDETVVHFSVMYRQVYELVDIFSFIRYNIYVPVFKILWTITVNILDLSLVLFQNKYSRNVHNFSKLAY